VLRDGKVEIFGLPGDKEDWETLFGDMWFTHLKVDKVSAARDLLSIAIQRWLTLTHIRPRFIWNARKPDFHFFGRRDEYGLFETLVMQLMLSVSRTQGMSVCREGLTSFFIDHSRKSASYCPECNKKVQHRQAVQRFHQKDKDNPNREKRKTLSPSEREAVIRRVVEAKGQGEKVSSVIDQLAREYKVTTSAIRKIVGRIT